MNLEFKRLHPNAILPAAVHDGDAGLDVTAAEAATIGPGERVLIPTGFAMAVPEGHAGLLLPRSGLAAKQGLTLVNSPGLIDPGYRGEVKVAVVNLDRTESVQISAGDRIAQLLIVGLPRATAEWVDDLSDTSRGDGGFGSTGVSQ